MVEPRQVLVIVDASLVFKWLVEEEDSDRARAMLTRWKGQDAKLAAPYFMLAEVTNALHRRVVDGTLGVVEASDLAESMLSPSIGMELHSHHGLHRRGVELANLMRQPAVYDSIYLALAEALNGELWTADRNFFRAASSQFSNVRWLREADVPS